MPEPKVDPITNTLYFSSLSSIQYTHSWIHCSLCVFDPMWNNVQVKCGSSQWKTLLFLYKRKKKLTTLLRRCNNAIHDLRVNDMAKGQMRLPKTIFLLEHQLLYGNLVLLQVQVLQKINKLPKINCNKKTRSKFHFDWRSLLWIILQLMIKWVRKIRPRVNRSNSKHFWIKSSSESWRLNDFSWKIQ